ncbi:N-acetylglucosaminidase [Clostridium swellfunianum]|uniref:N-acetylglucosaminidase n=1 Tax=Clostridium swellfunianum TaxID=1367462 RepID=UPI00202E7AA2|nr:N-acetylglucosaminidase [Clostridium swellfunianum]MCM0647443.1 N-acetylglucosaminidase [Clostridium swellfunianum]
MKEKLKRFLVSIITSSFILVCFSFVGVQAATRTADEYYNLYKQYNQYEPYNALKLLVEANANYPQDVRFINGINKESKTIIEWSIGSHNNKNFEGAIYGYDTILGTSSAHTSIKDFAKRQKVQAQTSKLPISANEYYALTTKYDSYQPYAALTILSEAIVGYPNDKRFINGVNERTNTIFEWSQGSHSNRHFDTSIYGYQTVINTLEASSELKSKAEIFMSYAKNNKMFYTAEQYNSTASQYIQTQPYDALKIYSEALLVYPGDKRIKDGSVKSARTILEWSLGSHSKGNYEAAAYGYRKVLEAQVLDYLKSYAQKQKDRADSKKAPITVKEYTSQINILGSDKPYDKLKLSSEALIISPSENTLKTSLNESAATILDWSFGSHLRGNFDSALYGYGRIIEAPDVKTYIYNGAVRQNQQAVKVLYPLKLSDYNKMEMPNVNISPYNALNIYSEIYTMFNDSNAKTKINDSAAVILDWSKGSHKRDYYGAAIYGYDEIISNPYVNSQIYGQANALKAIAEKGISYNEDSRYVINTSYGITFNEMVDLQMAKGGPLTYVNGSGWVSANRTEVEHYANPMNFMTGNNIYQFLVLSGQAGISTEDLNALLVDKGNLKGTAAAFIEASRKYNINEIYLVSHSLLETGNGTSLLATGTSYNGKVVYNMFGVGAYDKPFYPTDTGANPTAWGAKYAYDNGWFTPEAAIIGGAKFIGNGYINKDQDTLYKMKWNPNNVSHQYATDVAWATKQISRIKSLYDKAKNYILRFDIPIYK